MNTTIILVAGLYFAITLGLGLWVARKEKNRLDDYFLAGRKLPWYAISLSMTGSNIGTEHFVGMIGTAYAFGLAPATYEWGNFIPYSILIWICLPFFYRKKLFTIPEFLERRYSPSTRSAFAAITLSHMILAVLVPALYAGGRIVYEMALQTPLNSFNWTFMGCVTLISAATAIYCIYGGLLSVVWTDVLQVIILVVGGLLLIFLGLKDTGGIQHVIENNLQANTSEFSRFSLILPANHPVSPWTGVATFWFTLSLWYVCTNQFYIQRCLGAKSEWDAKMGVVGCAFIKVFLPFIIVFPGLVAFTKFGPGLAQDAVYVKLIDELLHPVGQGIMLAALIAAIMSTVSSVLNSSSTIWAFDVYKRFINKNASEEELVSVGRWSTFVIIVVSTFFAPLLIGREEGIFMYIQDMAALFAPSISVIFLAAFFWPHAHGRSATFTLFFGIVAGLFLWIASETWSVEWLPLLNRAAISWILCLAALILSTFTLQRHPGETFDSDMIWNTRWARLPQAERPLNRWGRNLMFWWIVMVSVSTCLFIIFH